MKIARLTTLIVLLLGLSQTLLAADTRTLGDRSFYRAGNSWTQVDPGGYEYAVAPDVISVKFREGINRADQDSLYSALGGTELRRAMTGWVDVEIPAGQDVFEAIDAYMASGLIEMAEPNTIGSYNIVPDDPSYGSQWFLPQVNLEQTWERTTGDPSIIVAVLDSGTEFTHEDLGPGADGYQNIWLNPGEDAWTDPTDPSTGNGIDDDGNGLIDDWIGWDFGSNNNDSSGTFFHGTAVAGVVAAKTNNATGVASVAGGWNSQGTLIMIAGVGDNAPQGSILDDAILYAAAEGAHVVQLSLTVGQSNAIDDAIQMVVDNNNMMVICSSGNSSNPFVGYPSINPNVMSIGATDQSDLKAGFSNFGPNLEIAAPGTSIFTLDLTPDYDFTSGTSFSSPIISGVIALMLAVNPDLENTVIRQILWDTADKVGPYNYNHDPSMPGRSLELGYGRVNAQAAVAAAAALLTLEFKRGFEEPVE